jgi:hypothetical protein
VERVEDLLREEFRRTDAELSTPLGAMLAKVATVRRRRVALTRMAAGAAAVVLVAAAMATVAGLTGGRGTQPGTAQPMYTAQVLSVALVDATHAYVLQKYCPMAGSDAPTGGLPSGAPTPDVQEECRPHLLATADAGVTWQRRPLPAKAANRNPDDEFMRGISLSLSLYVDVADRLVLHKPSGGFWTSADGGQSWQEPELVVHPRPFDNNGFSMEGPLSMNKDPRLPLNYEHPLVPASDGTVWMPCAEAACVYVAPDHFRDFERLNVPVPAPIVWVATSDGKTVYIGTGSREAPNLMRSNDGGATWSTVQLTGGLPAWCTYALAMPNGNLVMTVSTDKGGMFFLAAGSATVQPIAGAPTHPRLSLRDGWVIARITGKRQAPDSLVSLSPDYGATWRAVPAPTA